MFGIEMMTDKWFKLFQFLHFLYQNDFHVLFIPTMWSVRLLDEHTQSEADLMNYVLKSTSRTWSSVIGYLRFWIVPPVQLMHNYF